MLSEKQVKILTRNLAGKEDLYKMGMIFGYILGITVEKRENKNRRIKK